MKVDKRGLVYDDEGRLACEDGRAEPKLQQVEERNLEGTVGFSRAEADDFVQIIKRQITQAEKERYKTKSRTNKERLLKEVVDEEESNDEAEDKVIDSGE